MSVSAPHNETAIHFFDAVQILQLLEATGAVKFPAGALYQGCHIEGDRVGFAVSHCAPEKRKLGGHDIQKTIDENYEIQAMAARGLDKLKREWDLLDPHKALKDAGIDFREETRQIMEEQRFMQEQQAALDRDMQRLRADEQAELEEAAQAVMPNLTLADPTAFEGILKDADGLPGMEPPTIASAEQAQRITLSEKFGKVVHAVHNGEFASGVRAVYDKAHGKDRLYSDRCAVLEHGATTFRVPFLEGDSPDMIRTRFVAWLTSWGVALPVQQVLHAAMELWLSYRLHFPSKARVEMAGDAWYPLDPSTKA